MADNYYLTQKSKIMKRFAGFARFGKQALASPYDDELADAVMGEVRQEVERLLPELPYIGGRKNRLTQNLIGTTFSLALYKVLNARGEPIEQIARVHHQINEAYLFSLPRFRVRIIRFLVSTPLMQKLGQTLLKKRAAISQQRQYPGDFVFSYVEGDGQEFDFGLDYTECAIVKFFQAQGAGEFTRYVCLYDFLNSQLTGTGLRRTMTLAEGAEKCDFRFKIGHEPLNLQTTKME